MITCQKNPELIGMNNFGFGMKVVDLLSAFGFGHIFLKIKQRRGKEKTK